MSAEEHRRAAKLHEEEAEKEATGYRPAAVDWRTRTEEYRPELDGFPSYFYNPTEDHLAHTQGHRDQAEAHLRAANALEAQMTAECRPFERAERPKCPLLGAIERVEDLPRGVRLTIMDGIDITGLVAHMRCHFSLGRVVGTDRMPTCPLYLPSLVFERGHGRTVDVTTTDGSIVDTVRTRMREHAGP